MVKKLQRLSPEDKRDLKTWRRLNRPTFISAQNRLSGTDSVKQSQQEKLRKRVKVIKQLAGKQLKMKQTELCFQ